MTCGGKSDEEGWGLRTLWQIEQVDLSTVLLASGSSMAAEKVRWRPTEAMDENQQEAKKRSTLSAPASRRKN